VLGSKQGVVASPAVEIRQALRVSILIAGRKLLLADDSIAIQKVIDLTFTDEGMEVTTVGDGQDALEKLEQFKPDVVLADVFMPGVDGYKLCKFIKQSERFANVPVMLLIGTFEPFDEAEAKLAGADDVVTKPFQSIRQLVSRVGSLLSSESAQKNESAADYSTLGLAHPEPSETIPEVPHQPEETTAIPEVQYQPQQATVIPEIPDQPEHSNVRVFVEAPVMEESVEQASAEEHHCPPNIELQTADTQKLERIDDVPVGSAFANTDLATDNTLEMEAVPVANEQAIPFEEVASVPDEPMNYVPQQHEASQGFDDSVLDLGDVDNFEAAQADDDFVLDLDVEDEPASAVAPVISEAPAPVAPAPHFVESQIEAPVLEDSAEPSSADTQEWAIVTPVVEPQNWEIKPEPIAVASHAGAGELSPEAIEAISHRVVEHLSEKVVREIAWEVVPELSELLIKQRLDEQK
jgi:CheY-like chemotaxis protein